jgi:hypothetical protein
MLSYNTVDCVITALLIPVWLVITPNSLAIRLANLTVGSVRKRLNESFTLTPEQQSGLKALCAELVQAVRHRLSSRLLATLL